MTRKDTYSTKASRHNSLLARVINGRLLSGDFFRRYWGVLTLLMLFVLLHITNKYYCQTDMEQIRKLEAELEVSKTERVRAKSIYKSNTRESSMQARIDSMRLGLTVRTAPPFKLPAP